MRIPVCQIGAFFMSSPLQPQVCRGNLHGNGSVTASEQTCPLFPCGREPDKAETGRNSQI